MNTQKKKSLVIGALVIILSIGVVVVQHSSSTTVPTTPTTTPSASYTLATVALHKSASDCWTTVDGSVYNVTSWIAQHPGGSGAIISMCGVDGSSAFSGQHGGQKRPTSELASFKIGILTQ